VLQSLPLHQKFAFISCSLPSLCSRLADVGMVPGSVWEIIAKIPFSGPLILANGMIRISVREQDATRIMVEPA